MKLPRLGFGVSGAHGTPLVPEALTVKLIHQAIEGYLINSRLPIEPMFAEPQTIRVRDVELQACSDAAMFVHSVLHSTSRGAQLSTLPDLGRLARLVDPANPVVSALLAGHNQRDLFVWSLERAARRIPVPEEWLGFAARNQLPTGRRRLFESTHESEARIAVVNGLSGEQRVRRAFEVVWPVDEYLRFKQTTRLGNLGSLVRRGGEIVRGR